MAENSPGAAACDRTQPQDWYMNSVSTCGAMPGVRDWPPKLRAPLSNTRSNLGATALFAGHHPENTASPKILSRLGFRYERHELYPPSGLVHPSYLLRREGVAG
jgi:hypothetical protein